MNLDEALDRIALPLQLPYGGASTIEDTAGRTLAECANPYVALALAAVVNATPALAAENGELRQALGLTNQERPEHDPLRASVQQLREAWDQLDTETWDDPRFFALQAAILGALNAAKDGEREGSTS